MQKIMQKVTSVALAASMLFSMMSTTALAFADETGDSTSVSTDVTDAPAAEEADAVDSGSSNDADSSDATSAPTITDVVDLTHESYEDANSNDETTQDATSDVVDREETSESDANATEVSTPETAEPTFVGLQTVTPEYGDKLTADVGDSITLDALLNRDDVAVTYQWQRKQNFAVDTALALYNYEEDEPTWYDLSGKTPLRQRLSQIHLTLFGRAVKCTMLLWMPWTTLAQIAAMCRLRGILRTLCWTVIAFPLVLLRMEPLKSMHPTRKTPTPPASMTKASGNFPMKALQI